MQSTQSIQPDPLLKGGGGEGERKTNLILSLSCRNPSPVPSAFKIMPKVPDRTDETLGGLASADYANLNSDHHFQLQCATGPLTGRLATLAAHQDHTGSFRKHQCLGPTPRDSGRCWKASQEYERAARVEDTALVEHIFFSCPGLLPCLCR